MLLELIQDLYCVKLVLQLLHLNFFLLHLLSQMSLLDFLLVFDSSGILSEVLHKGILWAWSGEKYI